MTSEYQTCLFLLCGAGAASEGTRTLLCDLLLSDVRLLSSLTPLDNACACSSGVGTLLNLIVVVYSATAHLSTMVAMAHDQQYCLLIPIAYTTVLLTVNSNKPGELP